MATNDLLNPNKPPASAEKMGKKPLMIILFGVLIFFILVVVVISSSSDEPQPQSPATLRTSRNNDVASADDIIQGRSGLVNSGQPNVLEGTKNLDAPPPPPSRPDNPNLNMGTVGNPIENDPMVSVYREMENRAYIARTAVELRSLPVGATQSGNTSMADREAQIAAMRNTGDAAQAYQARLRQVQTMQQGQAGYVASGNSGAILGAGYMGQEGTNTQTASANQFDGNANRWDLGHQREASAPYELKTGFVIPAVLITGINSELRGSVQAQVSQNVYDTATGQHLLIPQGSRLIGEYSNAILYGQNRVLVAWQRIIFPDSTTLDLGAMIGADQAGYSGFEDKVNHHYLRTFSSAIFMSGIIAAVNLSQDNNNSNSDRQRASDAMSEALGNQLGQVTAQMINKNLNISPTVEIRPGFRFNVIVTKDIRFNAPYTPQIPR